MPHYKENTGLILPRNKYHIPSKCMHGRPLFGILTNGLIKNMFNKKWQNCLI
jgi:hypothetical protein